MYKHLTTLIAIGAIVLFYVMALIDYVRPETFGSQYIESYALFSFANKIALITLLINGTLIDSTKFKFIKFALAVIMLGAIMKILHLPAADLTLTLANLGFAITYFVHFYSKPGKSILDIMKMITVWLIVAPMLLIMYDRSIAADVQFAGELMAAATFLYFLYAERDSYLRNQNS